MPSLERLRQFEFFQSVPSGVLRKLLTRAQRVTFPRGAVIFRQGDPGDSCYFVLSGQLVAYVEDEAGDRLVSQLCSAGDHFGEMAILRGQARMATVEGILGGELLRIDADTFSWLRQAAPQWTSWISNKAQERLSREYEQELVFERRHPYTLIEALIIPFVLACLIMVLLAVLSSSGHLSATVLLAFMILCLLVFGGWTWWSYEDWRNDHFIVTSRRVVHVERTPLTSGRRSEALVSQVRGVSTDTPTPGARILGYKTLVVQTGTTLETIEFTGLADADEVGRKIIAARDRVRGRLSLEEKRQELSEQLRPYASSSGPETGEGSDDVGEGTGETSPRAKPSPDKLGRWAGPLAYLIPRMRRVESDRIIWHRHWYILFVRILAPVLVNLLLLVLVVSAILGDSSLLGLGLACPVPLLLLLFCAALFWLFWQYEDWHNDYYILTDAAIVDRDSLPLGFQERTQVFPLESVQNVRADVPGVAHKLLNMGDVLIDTIGGRESVKFDSVFNPFGIQGEVFQRMTALRGQQERRRAADLGEWFAAYHDLVRQGGYGTGRSTEPGEASSQPTSS
jgi:hypothetical protein